MVGIHCTVYSKEDQQQPTPSFLFGVLDQALHPIQETFVASMKGIVCDTNPAVRDEAPQAYKDLGQVP